MKRMAMTALARIGGSVAEARIGQRYRKIDGHGSVWEVVAIQADPNGIRHCQIVNVSDRTNAKVISESTLTKRKFYRVYAERAASYEEIE
jgi:hypothetical protein